MFSRTEREFLSLLASGPADTAQLRIASAFPNPVYRRKLLWGIRRKATRSLTDWHLYAAASAREERLLPPPVVPRGPEPPLFEDPMVTMIAALRRFLSSRRVRHGLGPSTGEGLK